MNPRTLRATQFLGTLKAVSTPKERLELAIEMFEVGVEMMRKKIERTRPDLSPSEVRALVQKWLLERPGAEQGDAIGVSVPFPRK